MKKIIFTFILFLLATAFAAEANPVAMRTVREVAMKFMNANGKDVLRSMDELELVATYNISRGDAAFYIFNIPNGFVIVSVDIRRYFRKMIEKDYYELPVLSFQELSAEINIQPLGRLKL